MKRAHTPSTSLTRMQMYKMMCKSGVLLCVLLQGKQHFCVNSKHLYVYEPAHHKLFRVIAHMCGGE
jgi:hypothetical protein